MSELSLTLPAEALNTLVEQVTAKVLERLEQTNGSPWMSRAECAQYLGWPASRLAKRRDIPHVKDDGRVVYHKPTIDQWLLDR